MFAKRFLPIDFCNALMRGENFSREAQSIIAAGVEPHLASPVFPNSIRDFPSVSNKWIGIRVPAIGCRVP
jgi:hypothetical protein